MKKFIFCFFLMTACLLSQPNWTNEPEELNFMKFSSGKHQITPQDYQSFDFKIRYHNKFEAPALNYNQDLSKIMLLELRFLKYELMARKGYLFEDAVIRDYFNTYDWYQPVYWIDDVKFSFTKEEEAFYKKIKEHEQILLKKQSEQDTFVLNSICNRRQIELTNPDFTGKLTANGFVVTEQKNVELFETYEENKYNRFPSFVTTDFLLQLLHLYFANILTTLEEENFIPLLKNITSTLYQKSKSDFESKTSEEAELSQFYFAMAYELLTGEKQSIPKKYEKERIDLLESIKATYGKQYVKLFDTEVDFSHFKPRSHYLLSKELSHYFRSMMWLGKVPFVAENETATKCANYIAGLFNENPAIKEKYFSITNILNFLIGKPNNKSILDLSNEHAKTENSNDNSGVRKITNKGFLADTREKVFFFSQLYTPDADIMNEMINLTFDATRREFPRGLDVFAVFGNKPAEDVLLNYYKENEKWSGFGKRLDSTKRLMTDMKFNENAYGFWLNSLNSIFVKNESFPKLMKKPNWDKKNLNSVLASYAELKHDAILYSEQPDAAEGDDGGTDSTYSLPPEPSWVGYVEPNVAFWNKSQEFINSLSKILQNYNIRNKTIEKATKDVLDMNEFFLEVSEKELKKEVLTDKEYDRIAGI